MIHNNNINYAAQYMVIIIFLVAHNVITLLKKNERNTLIRVYHQLI